MAPCTRSRSRIAMAHPIQFNLINKVSKRKSHGHEKNERDEKTSKKKRRGNSSDHDSDDNNVNGISNTITISSLHSRDVNLDHNIVYEIFSRLPVKSLMRFKCVCKQWNSIICKDRYVIDLHFSRSKARPRLLITVPGRSKKCKIRRTGKSSGKRLFYRALFFVTGDLLLEGGEVSVAVTRKMDTRSPYILSKPVNGLICLFDPIKNHSVRLCKISTREVTSWTISSFVSNLIVECTDSLRLAKCNLGFDPVTKEDKVICIWSIKRRQVCEVLTVGDGKWRRIDDVLPAYDFISCGNGDSVYVNGSIYYSPSNLKCSVKDDRPKIIAAFDVGKEKFRAIRIPGFIPDQIPDRNQPMNGVQLLEIDGHPALLSRILSGIVRIWLFDDDYKNGYRSNTWKELTTELPFNWGHKGSWRNDVDAVFFLSVLGTDFIILYSYFEDGYLRRRKVCQHIYNWKNKTFADIKIDGFPSSIPYLKHVSHVSTFVESLSPVL